MATKRKSRSEEFSLKTAQWKIPLSCNIFCVLCTVLYDCKNMSIWKKIVEQKFVKFGKIYIYAHNAKHSLSNFALKHNKEVFVVLISHKERLFHRLSPSFVITTLPDFYPVSGGWYQEREWGAGFARYPPLLQPLVLLVAQQLVSVGPSVDLLSLIHIWRCRRYSLCRSRWSPYH